MRSRPRLLSRSPPRSLSLRSRSCLRLPCRSLSLLRSLSRFRSFGLSFLSRPSPLLCSELFTPFVASTSPRSLQSRFFSNASRKASSFCLPMSISVSSAAPLAASDPGAPSFATSAPITLSVSPILHTWQCQRRRSGPVDMHPKRAAHPLTIPKTRCALARAQISLSGSSSTQHKGRALPAQRCRHGASICEAPASGVCVRAFARAMLACFHARWFAEEGLPRACVGSSGVGTRAELNGNTPQKPPASARLGVRLVRHAPSLPASPQENLIASSLQEHQSCN